MLFSHNYSLNVPSSTPTSGKVNTIDFFKADVNWWFMYIYETSLQRVHVASCRLIRATNSRSSRMTAKIKRDFLKIKLLGVFN
jgi:hypothetical protein